MIADFTAALPDIAANIAQSVISASQHAALPAASGTRGFYRIAADWSLDSDGDGRFDWQEINLDGNNPFAADSNGDGIPDHAPDRASDPTAIAADGTPRPVDAEGPTPEAVVEQSCEGARWHIHVRPNNPAYTPATYPRYGFVSRIGDTNAFDQSTSYGEFQDTFSSMIFPYVYGGSAPIVFGYQRTEPNDDGDYAIFYYSTRSSFRLRLDQPAPPGGYRIPVRLARVVQAENPDNFEPGEVSNVSVLEIELTVPEGQVTGPSVAILPQEPGVNQFITFFPVLYDLHGYNDLSYDTDILPVDRTTGVCVTTTGTLTNDVNSDTLNVAPLGTTARWQARRLNGGGTLGEWFYLEADNPNESFSVGRNFIHLRPPEPGIYQMQAVLTFPGNHRAEFPYVRMRDARSMKNSLDEANELLKAGQPDYFGVAPNEVSLAVRKGAIRWLGSKAYSWENWVITDPDWYFNPDTSRRSKCNIFVTHVANRAWARTPYFTRRGGFSISAPLAREDWFGEPEQNVDLDAPGWIFKGVPANPAPGMAVASPGAGGDSAVSGHVGILDYDGSWINAGKNTVNKSVHLSDQSTSYKPNNMRSR